MDKIKEFYSPSAIQNLIKMQRQWTNIFEEVQKPGKALIELTEKANSLKFSYLKFDFLVQIRNNPEIQFSYISDSEELNEALLYDTTLEELPDRIELINKNILPMLEHLSLIGLWTGTHESLNSDNPDKFRHCLISLRTLLEYMIHARLAPDELLSKENAFLKYFAGKKKKIIPRIERIRFFTSKIQFGILEEFSQNDIECILKCYEELCSVHHIEIKLSENQVKILIVKTGIILWLLLSLDKVLNNSDYKN